MHSSIRLSHFVLAERAADPLVDGAAVPRAHPAELVEPRLGEGDDGAARVIRDHRSWRRGRAPTSRSTSRLTLGWVSSRCCVQIPDAQRAARLARQVEQHVVLGERSAVVGELGAELPENGDLGAEERLPGVDGVRNDRSRDHASSADRADAFAGQPVKQD